VGEETDSRAGEDLRVLYSAGVAGISDLERRQWNVVYCTLLLETGAAGAHGALVVAASTGVSSRVILTVGVALVGTLACGLLARLAAAVGARREGLAAIRSRLGEAFRDDLAFGEPPPEPIEPAVAPLLYSAVTAGVGLAVWLIWAI